MIQLGTVLFCIKTIKMIQFRTVPDCIKKTEDMETMNKLLVMLLLVGLAACHNDEPKGYDIEQVAVQLTGDIADTEGIVVK